MRDLNLSILVVDDHSTIRTLLKTQLRRMGYTQISEAADGKSAYDILRQKNIGLIISDWNMPLMTGYELLKAVRGNERLAKTPFIMVTAESSPEYVSMALQLKVDQFILKPFTLAILEKKINQVIQ